MVEWNRFGIWVTEDAVMSVMLLSEEDVRQLLTMDMALEAVESVLRGMALDEAVNVPRARSQTGAAQKGTAVEHAGGETGSDSLQTRPARGSIFSLHQHVRGPISSG